MNCNTLAFISTHVIHEGIIDEYRKMSNCGVDTLLVVDNSHNLLEDNGKVLQIKELFGETVKCFLINIKHFQELDLPNFDGYGTHRSFSRTMWWNGDYRFYIVRKYFPQYDFYWQSDYDCFLNALSYEDFFKAFAQDESDLLSLRPFFDSKSNAEIYKVLSLDIEWLFNKSEIYRVLFAILRLSKKSLDVLYKERQKAARKLLKLKHQTDLRVQWPNCEVFVPSQVFRSGLSMRYMPGFFDINRGLDLNIDRIFSKPDNKIYHSIKADFKQRLEQKDEAIKALQSQNSTLNSAKFRIRNHLAYKLGQAIIENSKSFKGYVRMPYVLSYIKDKHKAEQKAYENKIEQNPELRLPALESYPDYQEALQEKQCLTYKLGQALIKASNNAWGGGMSNLYLRHLN